jgi:hypothetical protein
MTARLSIFAICKDACFVGFGISQHLTFQREVFSTFEEFTLSRKICLGNNNMLDVCGETLLSSICQIEFPSVLEMCRMFQSWQKNCYQLIS